ncbi:hypothetical protein DSO57_1031061 [Entomophthora muscae]|uniref:Uncharacterized protein n=1 Tax=Entomophthora muscae TaxID=34485 RepID=A0ACC2T0T8_9FUNG|nr:hypothetical protein DSO57_1031061 [Entomophthora muscae]
MKEIIVFENNGEFFSRFGDREVFHIHSECIMEASYKDKKVEFVDSAGSKIWTKKGCIHLWPTH